MTKIFTQNDLIRYIYDETSLEEDKKIEDALVCDVALLDNYHDYLHIKNSMNVMLMPRKNTIDNIIAYSKSLSENMVK